MITTTAALNAVPNDTFVYYAHDRFSGFVKRDVDTFVELKSGPQTFSAFAVLADGPLVAA